MKHFLQTHKLFMNKKLKKIVKNKVKNFCLKELNKREIVLTCLYNDAEALFLKKKFLMWFDEVNALWILKFKKIKFINCFTHKNMIINYEEEHTKVSSKMFKLSDITKLEKKIEI